ncbi:hypothetical protein [Lentimicrobium sp. S6]|nr:hypothetical protein [Lentimicrobium sp. S6]
MEFSSIIILAVYGFGFITVIILLIYLLFRRIKIKETEDFEERDN